MLRGYGHQVGTYTRSNDEIDFFSPSKKLKLAGQTIWAQNTIKNLKRVIAETRPEIAHFQNIFPLISPSAYWACRESGVSVVQTLRTYQLLCPVSTFFRKGGVCEECLGKTPPWPGIVHGCYRDSRAQTVVVAAMLTFHRIKQTWQEQVDVYIAPTEFARRKFIEGGLPAEKIVVKPNFVYPDPGVRESWGNYAIFLGRLSPEKGVGLLLRAWQSLKGIPLKIVGDGPLMGEVQKFAQSQKIENIEVLGPQSQEKVLGLIKKARCLIMPSEWYETFGRVLIESFACAVPVIASRLGAMAEIVEDRRTGLVFTPGDHEDLATKVEWAWDHPRQMQEMSREARAEFEAKYTVEINHALLMKIYQKALETHH